MDSAIPSPSSASASSERWACASPLYDVHPALLRLLHHLSVGGEWGDTRDTGETGVTAWWAAGRRRPAWRRGVMKPSVLCVMYACLLQALLTSMPQLLLPSCSRSFSPTGDKSQTVYESKAARQFEHLLRIRQAVHTIGLSFSTTCLSRWMSSSRGWLAPSKATAAGGSPVSLWGDFPPLSAAVSTSTTNAVVEVAAGGASLLGGLMGAGNSADGDTVLQLHFPHAWAIMGEEERRNDVAALLLAPLLLRLCIAGADCEGSSAAFEPCAVGERPRGESIAEMEQRCAVQAGAVRLLVRLLEASQAAALLPHLDNSSSSSVSSILSSLCAAGGAPVPLQPSYPSSYHWAAPHAPVASSASPCAASLSSSHPFSVPLCALWMAVQSVEALAALTATQEAARVDVCTLSGALPAAAPGSGQQPPAGERGMILKFAHRALEHAARAVEAHARSSTQQPRGKGLPSGASTHAEDGAAVAHLLPLRVATELAAVCCRLLLHVSRSPRCLRTYLTERKINLPVFALLSSLHSFFVSESALASASVSSSSFSSVTTAAVPIALPETLLKLLSNLWLEFSPMVPDVRDPRHIRAMEVVIQWSDIPRCADTGSGGDAAASPQWCACLVPDDQRRLQRAAVACLRNMTHRITSPLCRSLLQRIAVQHITLPEAMCAPPTVAATPDAPSSPASSSSTAFLSNTAVSSSPGSLDNLQPLTHSAPSSPQLQVVGAHAAAPAACGVSPLSGDNAAHMPISSSQAADERASRPRRTASSASPSSLSVSPSRQRRTASVSPLPSRRAAAAHRRPPLLLRLLRSGDAPVLAAAAAVLRNVTHITTPSTHMHHHHHHSGAGGGAGSGGGGASSSSSSGGSSATTASLLFVCMSRNILISEAERLLSGALRRESSVLQQQQQEDMQQKDSNDDTAAGEASSSSTLLLSEENLDRTTLLRLTAAAHAVFAVSNSVVSDAEVRGMRMYVT